MLEASSLQLNCTDIQCQYCLFGGSRTQKTSVKKRFSRRFTAVLSLQKMGHKSRVEFVFEFSLRVIWMYVNWTFTFLNYLSLSEVRMSRVNVWPPSSHARYCDVALASERNEYGGWAAELQHHSAVWFCASISCRFIGHRHVTVTFVL